MPEHEPSKGMTTAESQCSPGRLDGPMIFCEASCNLVTSHRSRINETGVELFSYRPRVFGSWSRGDRLELIPGALHHGLPQGGFELAYVRSVRVLQKRTLEIG